MTLQRRLLVLLLVSVPLVWAVAVVAALARARHEINELFDTQQIRLAQQVLTLVQSRGGADDGAWPEVVPAAGANGAAAGSSSGIGEAELADMSVAVWSRDGRLRLADREGMALPSRNDAPGFADVTLGTEPWRVYYVRSSSGDWTVAVGQAVEERDELLQGLIAGQLLPWLLMLPVLLIAMALVVRHAMKPLRVLAADLSVRGADDLHTVDASGLPREVLPVVDAMNRLFDKIRRTLDHERRLIADAAHELRTPLAALSAQWQAMRIADSVATRDAARARVEEGIERLERVVTQLLALSAVEARPEDVFATPVDWQRVLQAALSDCLPLVESAHGEVEVEWPETGSAMPLAGDEALLALMLRNVVDNALRYGGRRVVVRLAPDALTIDDDGPGVAPEVLARLGDRFYRPPGQTMPGSGLGVSIVKRVAELHALAVHFERSAAGGLRVVIRPAR